MKRFIFASVALMGLIVFILSCQDTKIDVKDYDISVSASCADTKVDTPAEGVLHLTKGEVDWQYTFEYKIDNDGSYVIKSGGQQKTSPASITFDFTREFAFQMPLLPEGTHSLAGVVTNHKGKTSMVSCTFEVIDTKPQVTLSAPSVLSLQKGETKKLEVELSPAEVKSSLTYAVDNSNVKVTQNDLTFTVEGVSAGESTITFSCLDKTAQTKVTVTKSPETISISPSSLNIKYNESKTFTVKSTGGYTYDVPSYTEVNESGEILSVKNCNSTYYNHETGITVVNKEDPSVKASAVITLEPKPESFNFTVSVGNESTTIKEDGENDGWEVTSIPTGVQKAVSGRTVTLTNSTYEEVKGVVSFRTKAQKVTEDVSVTVKAKKDASKGLSIEPDNWTITKGDKIDFKVMQYFESGETKDVTSDVSWSASNNLSGTKGSYTAIKTGDATVKVTLGSESVTSRGTIVDKELNLVSLSISPSSFSLTHGEKASFSATAHFDDESTQNVTSSCSWSGSNMTSEGSGNFVASNSTSSQVNASVSASYTYKGKSAEASVSGTVSPKETYSLSLGSSSLQWDAESTAAKSVSVNASSNVSWQIKSNSNSADFYASGSGKGNGTIQVSPRSANTSQSARKAVITVSGNNVSDVSIELTQYGSSVVAVTGVSVSPTSVSLVKGETKALSATVSPSNASNKAVSWESGSTSVAGVSSSGVVTAKSRGTATITVRSQANSSAYAQCAVTVNDYSMSTTDGGTSLNWACDGTNEQYKTIVTSGDWSIESNSNTSVFSARKDGSTLYVKPLSSNVGNKSSRSASIILRNNSDGNNKLTISATQAADGSDHSYKPTGTYTYGTPVVSLSYSPQTIAAEGGSSNADYSFVQQRWEIWKNDLGQTDPQSHEVSSVTSGGSWVFTGNASGFSVNSGNGKVTAEANPSTNARSIDVKATVSVNSVSGSATKKVSQEGKTDYTISVTPSSLSWDVNGGTKSVTVSTNGTWSIKDCPSWVSTSSSGNTLNLTVSANGTSSRSGSLVVKCNEDESRTATVSLSQAADTKTDTEYRNITVSFSAGQTSFTAAGGSTTLSSSASYESRDVYSSGKTSDWISQTGTPTISGNAEGFVRNGNSVTVNQNAMGGQRSVTYSAGFSIGGKSAEVKSVTLTQNADEVSSTEYRNLGVSIDAYQKNFTADGGSTTLSYSASYESRTLYQSGYQTSWTSTSGTPTITGGGSGFYLTGNTVNVSKNTGPERSATYYADFSIGGKSATQKSVTLTQSKGTVTYTISVSPSSLNWGWDGQSDGKYVSVSTNGTWSIDTSSDLTYFDVSKSGASGVSIKPKSANNDSGTRTGTLIIKCNEDNSKKATVQLTQEGSYVFCILSDASLGTGSEWPSGFSGSLIWKQDYNNSTVFKSGMETPGFTLAGGPGLSDGAVYVLEFSINMYRGSIDNKKLIGTKRTKLTQNVIEGDSPYVPANVEFKPNGDGDVTQWLDSNGMALRMKIVTQ